MLTEMKTSAVVLCIVTISSLEPLQVIAPKEQPSQWRGEQHRWWNGQPQWGNEQGQNPQRNRLEPLQVMAAPKKTLRWNRDGGKPYSRTEQPMQPWYDYPSGAYAAYPQNSQYNVAANMMPGASTYYSLPTGSLPPPLPTSEENTGDQTLNNAFRNALSMSTELTMAKWFERKLAERGFYQLESRGTQQAIICGQPYVAFVLSVLSRSPDKQKARMRFCSRNYAYRLEVLPAIEKRDSTTLDAKLFIDSEEFGYTLTALYKGPADRGRFVHAAFAGKFFHDASSRIEPDKSVKLTLYEA